MENEYFSRKINEGAIKRSHICSFDNSIKLEMIVTGSKKVIDYLISAQAVTNEKKEEAEIKAIKESKEQIIRLVSGLRINNKPIAFEQLAECFDSEEIMEVYAFVNGADMSIFGGKAGEEKKA